MLQTCFHSASASDGVFLKVWAGLLCLLQSNLHEMQIPQALHQLSEAECP